ncbi:glycoside hydrolase family 93 protein [Lentithecium fluviatile CBS 122367]|uniref:Glycoside hydrolase family 93 protein n=1 Tax=Lentithecium fluviatile CBS 122367 TaxID=1168545 RepID=A0A6G1IXW4_9PLEO|nr:glycoside hydrolase family 93 protein [Lentithecium fluviatile CBS 122367]
MRLLTTLILLLIALLATAQAHIKSGSAILFGKSGTYPRAIRLSRTSLLGTITEHASGNSTITTVRSTDNGQSWTPIGTVTTEISAGEDVDNGYPHQMPDGNILYAFRNHDLGNSVGNDPTHYHITLYYSQETGSGGQDSIIRTSTDSGKMWAALRAFTGQTTSARNGMLSVAYTAPKSAIKLAIFESGISGAFKVYVVRSPNDGAMWDPERTLLHGGDSFNTGAPWIIRVGDKLVASCTTNEDGGEWPTGAMKFDKTTVHGLPAMWTSMILLDDKSFLALYESGGTSFAQMYTFA